MIKPTTLSIALDEAKIANADKLLTSLLKKMRQYNDQVEKSNRLLREQEKLRYKLNIKVEKGKTIGLVEEKPVIKKEAPKQKIAPTTDQLPKA